MNGEQPAGTFLERSSRPKDIFKSRLENDDDGIEQDESKIESMTTESINQ